LPPLAEGRVITYGYRTTEVKLPPIPPTKPHIIKLLNDLRSSECRRPVKVSLGCHVQGATNPKPDLGDSASFLNGVKYRFLRKPPDPELEMMEHFGAFVKDWCEKNLTPLPFDVDISFETWLDKTPYTQSRKASLRRKFSNVDPCYSSKSAENHIYNRVKLFMKDESYPQYKYPRGINSRSDEFKCIVGPLFKLIEEQVFKSEWFIKKVPVSLRPADLLKNVHQEGARCIGTDYTSFESLFTQLLMAMCEMILYDHMTKNINSDWIKIVRKVMLGTNCCTYRDFIVFVLATRMSGEMCTSLGNGFSNLMIMLFVAYIKKLRSLKGRVEGDDGVFTFYGVQVSEEMFAKMGLLIKIDEYDNVLEGSFCGIRCDVDDLINVTSPIEALLEFGWTTREYADASEKKLLELLKAKSLSFAWQYPGCPIIQEMAHYGLRMTEAYHWNITNYNLWEKSEFLRELEHFKGGVPYKSPPSNSRRLVEKYYGISENLQIMVENYFKNKTDLSPINIPELRDLFHPDAADYYSRYSDVHGVGRLFVPQDVSNKFI
jgi:hypothetical protein